MLILMQNLAATLVSPRDLGITLLDYVDYVLEAITGKLLQSFLVGLLSFILSLVKSL